MKVKANASWKSIPLSQSFFSNIESASAVCGGIEELSDYTLVTKGKKSGKLLKRPLSCPKKSTLAESKEVITDDEPPKKKVAKKNVFTVVDNSEKVNDHDQVKSKKTKTKEKKKNLKLKKDKPVINLEALNCLQKQSGDNKENATNTTSEKVDNVQPVATNNEATKTEVSVNESKKQVKSKQNKKNKGGTKVSAKGVKLSEMTEWRELFVSEDIIKVLAAKGFKYPTPIQRMTLAPALQVNVISIAMNQNYENLSTLSILLLGQYLYYLRNQ